AALFCSSPALAAGPTLTIPGGRFSDGQNIGISGVGFMPAAKDPSGVQIIECSDPQGLTANLPTDPSSCDGATVNPLPVKTDSAVRFSAQYKVSALSMH